MVSHIFVVFIAVNNYVITVFLLIKVSSLIVAPPPEKFLNHDNLINNIKLIKIALFEEFDEYFL